MTNWKSFSFLFLIFLPQIAFSHPRPKDVLEETLYQEMKAKLLSSKSSLTHVGLSPLEQKLFVDALTELLLDNKPSAKKALELVPALVFEVPEKFRLALLQLSQGKKVSPFVINEVKTELKKPNPSRRLLYLVASSQDELLKYKQEEVIDLAKNHPEFYDVLVPEKDVSPEIIQDLFYHSPDVSTFMNGEYKTSVKVFMFCRKNRHYPCLMAMRDSKGAEVRNSDGSLWVHPSLASSRFDIPSSKTNGNTPAGIHTIDSVMPVADEPMSFGKYRRMILNFVPRSKDEALLKTLLPSSSHTEDWWKPSVIARDVGRGLLRIHGTGKINPDPHVPWFPFLQTEGCISQRENTYDNVTFKDQRDLLDEIMAGLGLEAKYENEVKVKGILYLVEIDDKESAVLSEDLKVIGIE